MDQTSVVFGLAALGYLLLAKDAALRIVGRRWPALGMLTALVVGTHVALVWAVRFEWSFAYAWEKGAPAFLLFHTALLLILLAPLTAPRLRDRLVWSAFGIVSLGALPAPFLYPEVRVLAVPLLAAFAGVATAVVTARRHRRAAGWAAG